MSTRDRRRQKVEWRVPEEFGGRGFGFRLFLGSITRRHAVCLCLWWSVKAGYAEN